MGSAFGAGQRAGIMGGNDPITAVLLDSEDAWDIY